ncbi:unnamed protein product [Bemisia tabaci]|uniref:SCP domain-containing protein n=1 Tax=Bemisia tabaci TaxID=7038 RepID=A0A9P0A6P7_BEMTA|nr:unnamed protein product [Bemisia tabaci]
MNIGGVGSSADCGSRVTASQRLLNFAELPADLIYNPEQHAQNLQPSIRRERATAGRYLQRRVDALRALKESTKIIEPFSGLSKYTLKKWPIDKMPQVLRKIIGNKPNIICEKDELRTAWNDSDFIAECLCWHNVYRFQHRVPPLQMSPQLCEKAQAWANHLAHTDSFFYRIDRDVGQNLFYRLTNALESDVTGQEVSSYWYSAVKQYDFSKEPDVLHANVNAGHFTQLVWANTRYLGVGRAQSRSGKIIVVANYSPAGNTSGQFQQNILPPVLDETDGVSLGRNSNQSKNSKKSD